MQDDVSIDTFVQKQRERHRRIRSEGISWAGESAPGEYRFLGLHWLTWIGMSAIAGSGWLASLPL